MSVDPSAAWKIIPIDQLPERLESQRNEGKKIVLCHGCFDLLHPGHIRYFESAKREGDVLVVTLTSDRHVNKGPGRPVFNEKLRAEFVASMTCVDFVSINDSPMAIEAIRIIKPDVYAKGAEYEDLDADLTGGIRLEKEAVEEHGGRVHFTHEVTFSSSKLLNRHFQILPEDTMIFLREFRERYCANDVLAALEKIRGLKILLIGDAVVDEYHYVRPMGKTAKANIIATRYLNEEKFAGGIFACANHVAGFCDQVHVVTGLGTMDTRESFIRSNLKSNVTMSPIYRHDAPTTIKRRFVDSNFLTKLFEVYYFQDKNLEGEKEAELLEKLDTLLPQYDVVIVLDYAHGLLSPKAIDLLCEKAKFLAVNTQTNAANVGYNPITKYKRADFVCIDEPEVRIATHDRFGDIESLLNHVMDKLQAKRGIVTRGYLGCVVRDRGCDHVSVPVLSQKVVDAVGAGDAFLSITAPCMAAGLPPELVGFIGNAVGAQAVTIVGNRESVDAVSLAKSIKTLLA